MKRLFLILTTCLLGMTLQAQVNPEIKQKYHEFDFWLGYWDVYKNGTDTIVGDSHIQSIIDSVGIQENYRAVKGKYQGKSLNKYNLSKKKWEQFWIDNSGYTLQMEGEYTDGKMVLGNDIPLADGKTFSNRITWFNNEDGTVRQLWEQSTNAGKTWTVAFDGLYRRKAAPKPSKRKKKRRRKKRTQ